MFYDLFIKVEGRGIGQTRPEPHEVPEIPGLQAFPERHPGSGVARRGLWILDAHRGKRLHAAGVEGAASLEVQIFAQTLRAVAKAEVGPSKECQTRQEASLVQLPKDVVVEDFLLHSRQKIALDIPSARQRARHAHRTKCLCRTLLIEEVSIPPRGDQVGAGEFRIGSKESALNVVGEKSRKRGEVLFRVGKLDAPPSSAVDDATAS